MGDGEIYTGKPMIGSKATSANFYYHALIEK